MVKKVFAIALIAFFWIASLCWYPTDALAFTEEQKLLLQSWRIVNQSYLDETLNHQNWWKLREKYVKKTIEKSRGSL